MSSGEVAGLLPPARKKRRHDDLLQALDLAESGLLPGLRHPPRPWVKDTIDLTKFSKENSEIYIKLTLSETSEVFVVTEQFREVMDLVYSENIKKIVIDGPKGVGKSMSLIAIAAILDSDDRPYFLWTPESYSTCWYEMYLRDICKPAADEILPDNVFALERKFFEKFPNATILLDLGGMTKYNSEEIKHLNTFFWTFIMKFKLVVSLSSGNGNFVEPNSNRKLNKMFKHIVKGAKKVTFSPFNDLEADVLINLKKSSYSLTKETYKDLTNYNPLLLWSCADMNSQSAAEVEINMEVRKFVSAVVSSISDVFKWAINSLPESIGLLYDAANEVEVRKSIVYLENTWLYAERIVYIAKTTDHGFILKTNFPSIYSALMEQLKESIPKDMKLLNNPTINGFMFEKYICERMKKLELYIQKQGGEKETAVFDFEITKAKTSGEPVRIMQSKVLYHLRDQHPVIDAAAYFKDQSRLLLIQVSLSGYKKHGSKAYDLTNDVKGCEKNPYIKLNWLQHYKKAAQGKIFGGSAATVQAVPAPEVIYVYISPKQFISDGTLPWNLMEENDKKMNISVGFVPAETDCSRWVSSQVHY